MPEEFTITDAIRHATMLICRASGTAIPPLPDPDRG
jgi:hypothetical protein